MDRDALFQIVLNIQRSGNVSLEKYFSRIKTLQLSDIFFDIGILERGWHMVLLASQSLTTLDLDHGASKFSPLDLVSHLRFTHNRVVLVGLHLPTAFTMIPFNLGQLPSLRHFKIHVPDYSRDVVMPRSLNQLLSRSMSSSTSIESLAIKIWVNVRLGRENGLFSSEARWPQLDEIITHENFVHLKKITLSYVVTIAGMEDDGEDGYQKKLAIERNLTLSCNALLPMFRSQRTLETRLVVV